jgi:hypothetical protein
MILTSTIKQKYLKKYKLTKVVFKKPRGPQSSWAKIGPIWFFFAGF